MQFFGQKDAFAQKMQFLREKDAVLVTNCSFWERKAYFYKKICCFLGQEDAFLIKNMLFLREKDAFLLNICSFWVKKTYLQKKYAVIG